MYNRNYEYFTTIAKERNISRAAEKLFISQPSLSKFLIQLEQQLGAELFVRSKNSLSLTPAGELYLNYIQNVQKLQEDFLTRLEKLNPGKEKEHLSLGITPGMASLVSYAILDTFRKRCPQVKLELTEDFGLQILSAFKHGRIDLALSMANALSDETDRETGVIPVLDDRIILAVPYSLPQAQEMGLSKNTVKNPYIPDELPFKHCPVITGKRSHILYQKTRQILDAYGLNPQSILETFNIDNCLRMVDAGHGIAFISQIYIENGPELNNTLFFTMDNPLFDCTRVIYYHRDTFSDSQKALTEVVRQVCQKLLLHGTHKP